MRITTGRNLHHVQQMTGLDPWNCIWGQLRKLLDEKLAELPVQDEWRLPYLGRLLDQSGQKYYLMEDTAELTELIDSLRVN